MSLAAACAWTLLRSLVVTVLFVPLCWAIRQKIASVSGWWRTLLWALLFVPFFTPALLVGYGYSNFALSLIRHPWWNEALYSLVVAFRFLAVGVLAMHFAPPPPISSAGMHVARLVLGGRKSGWLRRWAASWPFQVRGPWRSVFPAAALMFLFVFQEFETASLMNITLWTVWLFDAQAGGLMLDRSLNAAMIPAGCELFVLALLLVFSYRSQFLPASPAQRPAAVPAWLSCLVWCSAMGASVMVLGIPLFVVSRGATAGLAVVLQNRQMLNEIAVALGFGLGAGIPAALVAMLILRTAARGETGESRGSLICRRAWQLTCVLITLPGMVGSLAISLTLLWLFQSPPFSFVYDTPLPAALALCLFLLPRGLLILLLFEAMTPQQSLHAAGLLRSAPDRARRSAASELSWQIHTRRYFLAAGMLCLWGYLEMTPVAILAPPGLTSAPVRLYNLMHYSRSDVLSAMVVLAMLVPLALFLLAGTLRRIARVHFKI